MVVLGKHSHCTHTICCQVVDKDAECSHPEGSIRAKETARNKAYQWGYTLTNHLAKCGRGRGGGRGNHAWHCDRVLPAVSRTLALVTCSQKTQLSNPFPSVPTLRSFFFSPHIFPPCIPPVPVKLPSAFKAVCRLHKSGAWQLTLA